MVWTLTRKIKLGIAVALILLIAGSRWRTILRLDGRRPAEGMRPELHAAYTPLDAQVPGEGYSLAPLSGNEQYERVLRAACAKAVELGFEPAAMRVSVSATEWSRYTLAEPDFWSRHKELWERLLSKDFYPVHFSPRGTGPGLWIFVDSNYYTVVAYLSGR